MELFSGFVLIGQHISLECVEDLEGEYATVFSRAVLLGDASKNQDLPRALHTRKKLHCKRHFHGFQKGSVALV